MRGGRRHAIGLRTPAIETSSATYGPNARSVCNTDDPVCGGGSNSADRLQYARNGSTTHGARFAATKVRDRSWRGRRVSRRGPCATTAR